MSAAAFIYVYHHTPSDRVSHDFIGSRNYVPMAFTAESPLCPNIITAVLLLYILWTHPPPPDLLCLYTCKEFSVHGTISPYAVFQKLGSKLVKGMIMKKESIYSTDGTEDAGLSLHYIGV